MGAGSERRERAPAAGDEAPFVHQGPDAGPDRAPRRAVEYLLHTARRRLDMEAAFLAELTEAEQIYHATTGASAESFTIIEGGRLPRIEGYCKRVMESNAPWVIRDTSTEPDVRDLLITAAGRFGAYIGVPVSYPDGRPFGTLCCLSHQARPELGARDVAVLETLADLLGFHVDQLDAGHTELTQVESYAEQLADRLGHSEFRLEVFRHLVDASPIPMLLLHPGSLFIEYANPAAAELVGLDRARLHGPPWRHHRCWGRATLRRHLAPLSGDETPEVRYEQAPIDGAPAMDVRARHISTDAGTSFILWSAHDVSTHHDSEQRLRDALEMERHASEEMRRAHQLRDAFLTAISHELRTPLTAVTGAAQTLHAGRADAQMADRLLERLLVNADRLDRLLEDLLDLNQFAHGRLQVERETWRLDELVAAAVDQVDLADRELRLSLAPVDARVAPVKFQRIVINLLTNAVVHTPAGSAIGVQLAANGDDVQLVVDDRGPGVPPNEREAIFAPFQQGETVPPHRPGTGIGLSLVAAFVDLHGGNVWVDEAPGGHGAAFHVRFPRWTDERSRHT